MEAVKLAEVQALWRDTSQSQFTNSQIGEFSPGFMEPLKHGKILNALSLKLFLGQTPREVSLSRAVKVRIFSQEVV